MLKRVVWMKLKQVSWVYPKMDTFGASLFISFKVYKMYIFDQQHMHSIIGSNVAQIRINDHRTVNFLRPTCKLVSLRKSEMKTLFIGPLKMRCWR